MPRTSAHAQADTQTPCKQTPGSLGPGMALKCPQATLAHVRELAARHPQSNVSSGCRVWEYAFIEVRRDGGAEKCAWKPGHPTA
ncbi:hypothetical protein NDU88_003814 [Pleurodeles waltl]|uniref:Uncharacterized protein n=1 Tax=Pleurodeles waltl TaxID=8319 RepID=A0AAV7PAN7_PLEWA|nr:hypothetical protein NDU88_003814 [Pleurodeles waltl]